MNTSMPGFCNPMALSMPPYTSATRLLVLVLVINGLSGFVADKLAKK